MTKLMVQVRNEVAEIAKLDSKPAKRVLYVWPIEKFEAEVAELSETGLSVSSIADSLVDLAAANL